MKNKVNLFVPGRLCIFGEHSDWAGEYCSSYPELPEGRCIIVATNQGLKATAEYLSSGFRIVQPVPGRDELVDSFYSSSLEARAAAENPKDFNAYAAGTGALLMERYPSSGVKLTITEQSLPLKKGLSSSAAVCVTTARAFSLVNNLKLTIDEEMDFAYHGELLTGSKCGRMDQACAYGEGASLLAFRGDNTSLERIEGKKGIFLLIVDLEAEKNTKLILSDLNRAFLEGEKGIREALGADNIRITTAAWQAIKDCDSRLLGELMTEAQDIFDRKIAPNCPSQLMAPVLHTVIHAGMETGLALGGKGVGSQGDGTAQFICRGVEEREQLKNILEDSLGVECYPLTL